MIENGWHSVHIRNSSGTVHFTSIFFYNGQPDHLIGSEDDRLSDWLNYASCGTLITNPAETTDRPVNCKKCLFHTS